MSQPTLLRKEPGVGEVERKQSFAAAMELCAETAGYVLDKQCCSDLGIDKARWSRIKSGQEGIKWDQLAAFMDACGNDSPLLWMLSQRGYDLHSLRRRERDVDRELRETKEQLEQERRDRRVIEESMRRILSGAR